MTGLILAATTLASVLVSVSSSEMAQLAFKSPRADVGEDCWFTDYCDIQGDNEVETTEDDYTTPEECYAACGANADCEFFSFSKYFGGKTVCILLKTCDATRSPPPGAVSGPKDCSVVNPCPMLTYTTGSAVWSCENRLNPYLNDIPDGYTCHTSCGGWKSADGSETVKASSKCVNGAWEAVVENPVSDGAVVINTPDTDTDCTCLPFEIWYNPNEEEGADFYCTSTDFSDAAPDNVKTIGTDEECVLMCHNFIVADIMCTNGQWTDADPELGIACYKAPPTRTAPATTTPSATT